MVVLAIGVAGVAVLAEFWWAFAYIESDVRRHGGVIPEFWGVSFLSGVAVLEAGITLGATARLIVDHQPWRVVLRRFVIVVWLANLVSLLVTWWYFMSGGVLLL